MARLARKNLNTEFIHVMVQGVNKEYIFDKPQYLSYYLKNIKKKSTKNSFELIAYCMMNNHGHFLFHVTNMTDFETFMKDNNQKFASFYNNCENRVGVVFRNRYQIEPIYDIRHIKNCIKYIHNNPVKAKMVKQSKDYPYSSCNEYLNKTGVSKSDVVKQIYGEHADFSRIFEQADEMIFMDYETEKNINAYIEQGLKNFSHVYGCRIGDIICERELMKRLIKYLKRECKINYNDSIKYFGFSRGVANGLKVTNL